LGIASIAGLLIYCTTLLTKRQFCAIIYIQNKKYLQKDFGIRSKNKYKHKNKYERQTFKIW